MLHKTSFLTALLFLLVIVSGCQLTAEMCLSSVTPTLPDPHHHVTDIHQTAVDPLTLSEIRIAEIQVTANLVREQEIVNQEKTWLAFTSCEETCRLFVENLQTGQLYEVQGVPLSWRPFSGLTWVSDTILVFDRWSQPHYGIHYVVDVARREVISASPFADELP